MAFGDSSGPPANGRQLRELLELLEAAGHSDYRDARGPMGFTQRQAAGKFTSSEADEFIEQLQIELHGDGPPPGSHAPPPTRAPAAKKKKAAPRAAAVTPPAQPVPLRGVPVEELAAELQRRGWIVLEP
ncbi:MAG: hypothetical protein WA964_02495 [Ilumatobacter sp.]|uniref:hypothetical protein n=1 Tax=Ilumatobacter sp. TaxID=1967498 RepID=UPI003C762A6F